MVKMMGLILALVAAAASADNLPHYATRDTQGPPSVRLLDQLHHQGLELVTIVNLPDGRFRTYLRKESSADRTIRLTRVPDQMGFGREWFHAEYVPAAPGCPAPTFSVTPYIWIEPYDRDPFYGWIAGESGTYTVTARSTNEGGCGAEGALTIVIQH